MANIGTEQLFPEDWATSFNKLDIGNYPLANYVDRDIENIVARAGDSVNVPITPDFGYATDWTPGNTIVPITVTQEMVNVKLDKSKSITFPIDQTELAKSPYNLVEKYGVSAAKSLIKAVNRDIYLEMLKTSNFVDAISSFTKSSVIAARTKLSKNEVENERFFLSSPDDYGDMLNFDDFARVDYLGSQEAIIKGQLTNRYNMSIVETQAIDTYTPADLSGAINNAAGYVLGDTTIAVNGFNDDANPIRVGDLFKIAGETGTPYHTVISTVTTGSDTTSITFTPALVSAVADGAVVTITPSRSCIAGAKSAVAFAARAYPEFQQGNGILSAVMMLAGLPIRISQVVNPTTYTTNVQYDILYGVKIVNPNRLVRVLRA